MDSALLSQYTETIFALRVMKFTIHVHFRDLGFVLNVDFFIKLINGLIDSPTLLNDMNFNVFGSSI